jgi:hypothetical protein
MARVLSKSKNPFRPDQVVKATKTFATDKHIVHVGEEYRGNDPIVVENWSAFVDAGTLDREMPNFWDTVPVPPDHRSPVQVQEQTIPVHRQVRSRVDMYWDGGYAPDSPGAKTGRPSGFGTALRMGQVLDVGDEIVRRNPSWFIWPEREVSAADVERLSRSEGVR